MKTFLQKISPQTNAANIASPLYVAQGTNDPRVPATESRQIVETVRGQGRDVWYLEFKDEGHGFQKKPNRDYHLAAQMLFLETHLLKP
jgi:dipeptidyl aminopeptidase/acylaminoacyl peptidase